MAVKISTVGLHFPAIKYNVITRLSDCQVNVEMPDSLYASEEVLRVDSLAVAQDSSFARLADKVPLSAREQAAYATIDSTMQFEQAFQPTGFLARLLVKEQGEETEERTEQAAEKAEVRVEPSRWGSVRSEARFAIRPGGWGASGAGGEPGSGRRLGGRCRYRIQRWSEALVLPGPGRLAADSG